MAGNQGLHSAANGLLGGRPKLEATKLREALIRQMEEKAEPLAKALIDRGLKGDVQALKEILDRGIGKVVQGVDHTSAGKELPSPILSVVNNGTLGLTARSPNGILGNNRDEESVGDA